MEFSSSCRILNWYTEHCQLNLLALRIWCSAHSIQGANTVECNCIILITYQILTPRIPWDQKLVNCSLGSLCEEKYIFFNFFFRTSELHILQAFQEHQAHQIPTLYEPVVKFCSKWVLSSFFMYFVLYEELFHATMWLKLPKG